MKIFNRHYNRQENPRSVLKHITRLQIEEETSFEPFWDMEPSDYDEDYYDPFIPDFYIAEYSNGF